MAEISKTVSNYYLIRVDVELVNDGRVMRTPQGQVTLPMTVHEKEAVVQHIPNEIGEILEKGDWINGRIY